MSIVQNSFQVIPPQQPSSQYKGVYLHQSIIKSFNLNQSQVKLNKQNNNSLPTIETNLLDTFNPEVFQPILQQPLSISRQSQHHVSSFPLRSLSQNNKVRVSFSYNNLNRPIVNGNAFSSNLNRNSFIGSGMNIISGRKNNFISEQQRYNSMENNRPFSNLSELSKSKKQYPQPIAFDNNPLTKFSHQSSNNNNEILKTHKLGKKFKTIKFSTNTDNMVTQKSQHSSFKNKQQKNNDSFEVVDSPRKNMSSISIQRSEYVFLTGDKNEELINITPQEYVYSQKNLNQRKLTKSQNQLYTNNNNHNHNPSIHHSIILPIQQQNFSQINLQANKEEYVHYRKSPKKIDNRVYLEEDKGLKKMDDRRDEQMSQFGQLNKLSKITIKNHLNHEVVAGGENILSQQELNQIQHYQDEQDKGEIQHQRKQHQQHQTQQTTNLLTKISQLQKQLNQKQQQNKNLTIRLQNQQLQQKLHSQYQKLQLISKLNQIQIKKLKNEIKMFKIRQKFFINSEKQHLNQIAQLKNEINRRKNNSWEEHYLSPIFNRNRKEDNVKGVYF